MPSMRLFFLVPLILAAAALPAAEPPKTAQAMGLLKTTCLGCHNAEKKKGGLSLETRELALQGGENGAAFIPGKGADSKLVQQLLEGSDPHMPPKKQLSEKQIAIFQAWVDGGAEWDEKALKSFGEFASADKLGDLPSAVQSSYAMAVSPDGAKIAVTSGSLVKVLDATKPGRPVIATLTGHRDVVQSLAWSADGKWLAAGGYRKVLVWDAASWQVAHTLTAPLEGRQTALLFLPDNETLVIADGAEAQRGLLCWWKISEPKPLASIEAHKDNVLSLAVSRDGKKLASGSADYLVKVWDTATHKELAKLEGHTGHVLGLAFNGDGTMLASAGADKELKVWEVASKQMVMQLGDKTSAVTAVQWSADSARLYACRADGGVRLYTELKAHDGVRSFETNGTEKKMPGISDLAAVAVLSPDGKRLYVSTAEGNVFAWNEKGNLEDEKGLPVSPAVATAPESKEAAAPLSFARDILPILSKAGCNMGSCHAKASGQAGFKLSVFAYDPLSDYRAIVKDDHGRRVFPALPEESLILKKPTVEIAHEGGQRIEPGSPWFQAITTWIKQGMPYTLKDESPLASIDVTPAAKTCAKNSSHPQKVTAKYKDGSTRDVTALADYVSNEKGVATVDEKGVLKTGAYSGETAIVVRYMGQVGVSRVAIAPDKILPDAMYAKLPVNNEIDRLAYARHKEIGCLPSEGCTDAEFLRRSSLDAIGTLPTVEEARAFAESKEPKKREQWIAHLLDQPAWADHWAVKFDDLLRPNPSRVGVKPVFLFDDWLRQSFRANKPWDQIVRELLTAQGSTHKYGPVALWRDKREPVDAAAFVAEIFLGVRMECAKCHHHPNERWDISDYYQLAAHFTRLHHKGQGISAPISGEPEYWWFASGDAGIAHPITNAMLKPKPPGGLEKPIAETQDPRAALADWMTAPDNPFFAKAIVNRIWSQFFGRGVVDPVDDFRTSNPPSNGPMLDWLAKDFIAHHFDLKHLMATIMSSHLYQLSSLPNDTNKADLKNYSRSYRRRLPAEVLLDAVCAVTESNESFLGTQTGTRALQTWNVKLESEFMDAFGRPNSSAECPCERDAKPSVVQALHLMNSTKLQAKLDDDAGRVMRLAKSKMNSEEIVEELYLAAFSRKPAPEELAVASKAIALAGDKRKDAIEDVLWAMLNSAEFVFNH